MGSGETEATVIPQLRQVFRMTKAGLDALAGLRDGALGFATDETILYRQNGDGAANWEAITILSLVTNGSYVGNDTANRGIPHGLGTEPKLVALVRHGADWDVLFIMIGNVYIAALRPTAGVHAVDAPDDANFYVGNAANYETSGNKTGTTYDWVAF